MTIAELDGLYESCISKQNSTVSNLSEIIPTKFTITLSNVLKINRNAIPTALINFLKEELNFLNTEFLIKKKSNKNTFGTERYFKFIEETENIVIIPKGFVGQTIRFCRENKIEYDFIDERKKLKEISFSFNAQLKEHQKTVIDAIEKKDLGVIVAPPGSGKTVVGLKIIANKKQPAL